MGNLSSYFSKKVADKLKITQMTQQKKSRQMVSFLMGICAVGAIILVLYLGYEFGVWLQ